jgi:hypothetical protein
MGLEVIFSYYKSTYICDMKQIPLTKGQFALVDDEDFEFLNQWKWNAYKSKYSYYARRSAKKSDGAHYKNRNVIFMHNVILGTKNGLVGDHKDGNGLNNQRENLRMATRSQNTANKRAYGKSKYLGVYFDTTARKWRATIKNNDKVLCLGRFYLEEDAAKAYDKKAIEIHGEFANLNFKLATV